MVNGTRNLKITDIRTILPARNFERSKWFYLALGWKLHSADEYMAVLENANKRIYLSNHYSQSWAENVTLHISVEDARAWKAHLVSVLEGGDFPDARVKGPKQEQYGALVTYAWDPSGVLLHFAEWNLG